MRCSSVELYANTPFPFEFSISDGLAISELSFFTPVESFPNAPEEFK